MTRLNLATLRRLADPLRAARHRVHAAPLDLGALLASLPVDRPLICCEGLLARLPALLDPLLSPGERFERLEAVMDHVAPALARLEAVHEERSPATREATATADRVLDRFARAYAEVAATLAGQTGHPQRQHQPVLRRAALRAGQLAYRRVVLACRTYGELGPSHLDTPLEVFALLERHGLQHDALESGSSESIARIVGRIVLLILSDPQAMTRRLFEHTRFYVERYGHLVRVVERQKWSGDAEGWFIVSPADAGVRPLLHDGDLDHHPGARLLLDAHPLLARLDAQREGLAANTSPTRLGLPLQARDPEYIELLSRLRVRWGSPPLRRQTRRDARPAAEVVIGFEQVRQYVKHAVSRRSRTDLPDFPVTDWEIRDRSATGMGLYHHAEEPIDVDVGELLAMTPREDGELRLAVARRTRCRNAHETEIGVELLCGSGIAARFKPPQRDANGDERAPIPIIFLPRVPALQGGPGLLAPAGQVESGLTVALSHRNGVARFEAGARIERFASCDLIRLDPAG